MKQKKAAQIAKSKSVKLHTPMVEELKFTDLNNPNLYKNNSWYYSDFNKRFELLRKDIKRTRMKGNQNSYTLDRNFSNSRDYKDQSVDHSDSNINKSK